ncbi:RagB/SusD family nutrient uptake outer membrane protein [Sphingobacterium olei]|uniref:RagB/SusD family nutrient uptake outer membrane protein n=1 Tax=Sphingobacterium olei TaxID=2571155 RepID=A0A4U0PB82_9SPHI|nr:RagB/SusD family nutrient uptake outer membrane protein [Sphingobacterium olei]TJZ59914.1 RagB/SusD family nutrient uptake outer membrane protein [Sphingobacterium olei]
MKRFKKLILLFLLPATVLSGCDGILDVEQESSIIGSGFWNTPDDVNAYLTGIYNTFRSGDGTGAGGVMNTTFWLEDRGDSFEQGLESGVTNAWQQNLNNANAPNWLSIYELIQQCNMLLKYAPTITYVNTEDQDRAIAETLFIRSYMYFLLLRTYGDVPLELEPTESDDKPPLARAPANEVMAQVLADVEEALNRFPEGLSNKTRVSKPAAHALKAEALVWKNKVLSGSTTDLENALVSIDAALQHVSLVADYKMIFATDNKRNSEILLSLHFQRDEKSDHYGSRLKPRNIFVQNAVNADLIPYALGGARSVYAPSQKLIEQLNEFPTDSRRDASIITAVNTNGSVIGVFDNKFRGTAYSDDRHYDNDLIIYRWGGLQLTKAEILAALNRTQEAITALDLVRSRAKINGYGGSTTKANVERAILDEAFKELWFEQKRWPDLVRFHFGGTIDIYEEVPNLRDKTLPLFFPIPQIQIDLNPLLKQTEGYITP